MKDIEEKNRFRGYIASVKRTYTDEEMNCKSEQIFSNLEKLSIFKDAQKIFTYNNLKDEVRTLDFIRKWNVHKDFYLPVVSGENLIFRKYDDKVRFNKANLGVMEPEGENYRDYDSVDMIIVPGLAFDRRLNRLGRGRGYYDRFLCQLNAVKVGVCFGFQLFDDIPCDEQDIRMDLVVSENDIVKA